VHTSSRPRHTDLRPLTTSQTSILQTRPDVVSQPQQLSGFSDYSKSPASSISLASPTLAAIRQYYIDHGLRTALQVSSATRRRSSTHAKDLPRRHSVLTPGSVATRMGEFNFASPINPGVINEECSPTFVQHTGPHSNTIADGSRQALLSGIDRNELATLGSVVTESEAVLPKLGNKIPTEYTYNRLREWGHVYFGNTATADAFVTAVHLRKSSHVDRDRKTQTQCQQPELWDNSDDAVNSRVEQLRQPSATDNQEKESISCDLVKRDLVIRARIIPIAKERKPFLIQRRFNLQGLRIQRQESKVEGKSHGNVSGRAAPAFGSKMPRVLETEAVNIRPNSTPSSHVSSKDQRTIQNHAIRKNPTSNDRRSVPIRKSHFLPSSST
jgi:hypothetical protein